VYENGVEKQRRKRWRHRLQKPWTLKQGKDAKNGYHVKHKRESQREIKG